MIFYLGAMFIFIVLGLISLCGPFIIASYDAGVDIVGSTDMSWNASGVIDFIEAIFTMQLPDIVWLSVFFWVMTIFGILLVAAGLIRGLS